MVRSAFSMDKSFLSCNTASDILKIGYQKMGREQSKNFYRTDEHAYNTDSNGLSMTGILFMLYQDLRMLMCCLLYTSDAADEVCRV